MNEDTIHVVMCTYQGEKYIAEQLDSILFQTYLNFKIHVFDDCSDDKTLSIVKEYSQKFLNIEWHKSSKNRGFIKNFENAIMSISGNYIALSDQDDIWSPDKLEICMRELKLLEKESPNTPALVHTDLSLINFSGKELFTSFFESKTIDLPKERSLNSILGHCGVMGNTILMNKLLVDKALPFPDNLKYHDYWLAVINEIFGIRKTVKKRLVKYRIHDNNVSNNNKILMNNKLKPTRPKFRDYPLPFKEDDREIPIQYLLNSYQLDTEDKRLLKKYYDYLIFKGDRFNQFYFLIRYGLLKRDYKYRLSVFFRIMLTKRYL